MSVEQSAIRELRAKWLVLVAGAALLMFQGGMITFSLPFMYKELIDHFGWSREQVTALSSIKFISAAVTALLCGNYLERLGFRRMAVLIGLTGTIGMCSFFFVNSLPAYYGAGIAVGFCTGGTIILVKTLLSLSFDRMQGLALGLAMIGFLSGGILAPLIFSALVETDGIGWRLAPALLTIPIWLVAQPVFLTVTSPKRLSAFGVFSKSAGKSTFMDELRFLTRRWEFYPVAIGLFLIGMVDQGIVQHNPLFLETQLGIGKGQAAQLVSSGVALSILSKIAFGMIFDRFSVKGVAAVYLYFALICFAALQVTDMTSAIIFVSAFAIGHGGMTAEGPILAKHIFGVQNVSRRIGIFTAILSVGYATGTWFLGRSFDMTGSYAFGFTGLMLFSLVAGLSLIWVRPVAWLAARQARALAAAGAGG